MGNPITLLKGLGLGAGLMYLFDPRQGRRRRAELGDQVTHLMNEAADLFQAGGRDLANRAQGTLAEARGHLMPGRADDLTLVARVRSELGRCCSHPKAVRVNCRDGAVMLSGPVLAADVDRLLANVARVRGVREVIDRLEVHAEPGGRMSLQGGRSRSGEGSGSWSPSAKMMVATAGAVAGLALIRRSGLLLPAVGLLGAAYAASRSEGDPLETLGGWGERALIWGRERLGMETGPEPLGTGTGPVHRVGGQS
jgi:hypothetical protein